MMFPLQHFLILSAILFSVGLLLVVIKRHAIMMLIGIELMLNAANLNLVAFNQLYLNHRDGQMFALFVIIVAVCETAVGLAIILRTYHFYQTSVPDAVAELSDKP